MRKGAAAGRVDERDQAEAGRLFASFQRTELEFLEHRLCLFVLEIRLLSIAAFGECRAACLVEVPPGRLS